MAILDSPKVLLGVLLGALLGVLLLGFLLWKLITKLLRKRRLMVVSTSPSSIMNKDDNSVMVLKDDEMVFVLNDDIVWEIVVRLPVKALMRFKCVSKHWNSTIRHPLFAKVYIGGFHGLLIAQVPCCSRLHEVEEDIAEGFYATCFNSNIGYDNRKKSKIQAYSYPVAIDRKFVTYGRLCCTNVVKGLFGFYNGLGEFKLCNIATHELLDLPIKSLHESNESSGLSIKCVYYLAFEPVMEVYKLLRFCYIGYCDDAYLQICTIGRGEGGGGDGNDLDWRDLGPVPQLARTRAMQKTCINEILYLMGWKFMDDKWNRPLVVFDLSTETISETIPLPESVAAFVETTELVQLGGRPALISLASQLGMIWILNDNRWTEIRSVDLMGITDLTCAGNLPTGELLLAQKTNGKDPLPIYKYDHIQNKVMKWIEVDLCFRSIEPGQHFWKICYYEDNILALDCFRRR